MADPGRTLSLRFLNAVPVFSVILRLHERVQYALLPPTCRLQLSPTSQVAFPLNISSTNCLSSPNSALDPAYKVHKSHTRLYLRLGAHSPEKLTLNKSETQPSLGTLNKNILVQQAKSQLTSTGWWAAGEAEARGVHDPPQHTEDTQPRRHHVAPSRCRALFQIPRSGMRRLRENQTNRAHKDCGVRP